MIATEHMFFLLFTFFLLMYALLDGFDLGVGIIYLLTKDRRAMLRAIGPVWDGNEVWLIVAGGALFAGFPSVYATLCSAFYVPIMGLLTALILRAVSIEVRNSFSNPLWQRCWDALFATGSSMATGILGIALGNLIRGIPLTSEQEYAGTTLDLLSPYAFLIGVLVLLLFALHGAGYCQLKILTTAQVDRHIPLLKILFFAAYIATIYFTAVYQSYFFNHSDMFFYIIVVSNLLAALMVVLSKKHHLFFYTSLTIGSGLALFSLGTYPTMIRALDTTLNMTVYNAAGSPLALTTALWYTGIGVPIILLYTAFAYTVLHEKET